MRFVKLFALSAGLGLLHLALCVVVFGISAGIELDTSRPPEEVASAGHVITWIIHLLSFPTMYSLWARFLPEPLIIPCAIANSFAFGILLAIVIRNYSSRSVLSRVP